MMPKAELCFHCGGAIEPATELVNGSRYRHSSTGLRSCLEKAIAGYPMSQIAEVEPSEATEHLPTFEEI